MKEWRKRRIENICSEKEEESTTFFCKEKGRQITGYFTFETTTSTSASTTAATTEPTDKALHLIREMDWVRR